MLQTHRVFRRAALAALLTFAAVRLGAQTPGAAGNASTENAVPVPSMLPAESPEMLGVIAATEYEHIFSSNLKSGASGKMSINRFVTGARYGHDWASNHLTLGGSYTYNNYSFNNINPQPFGNVQRVGLSALYSYDITDQWGVFGQLAGGFAAETATTLTRGELFSAALGPTYRWSKDLSFYIGPMFYTRLEDSNSISAAGKLDWQIDPNWSLHLFAGTVYGGTVAYDIFADHLTVVEGTVQYESNWFRTRNTTAGKQAVNETGTSVRLGVTQRFWTMCFVRVYAEGVFSRTYQFHVNGNSANSFNVDAGAGVGLQVGVGF